MGSLTGQARRRGTRGCMGRKEEGRGSAAQRGVRHAGRPVAFSFTEPDRECKHKHAASPDVSSTDRHCTHRQWLTPCRTNRKVRGWAVATRATHLVGVGIRVRSRVGGAWPLGTKRGASTWGGCLPASLPACPFACRSASTPCPATSAALGDTLIKPSLWP